MGAMRRLVVAPPVHAPWGSVRAVASHACRRRPIDIATTIKEGEKAHLGPKSEYLLFYAFNLPEIS